MSTDAFVLTDPVAGSPVELFMFGEADGVSEFPEVAHWAFGCCSVARCPRCPTEVVELVEDAGDESPSLVPINNYGINYVYKALC